MPHRTSVIYAPFAADLSVMRTLQPYRRSPMRNALTAAGWTLRGAGEQGTLRSVLAARFTQLPADLVEFLVDAAGATSPDKTTWLLNLNDYTGVSAVAFPWNAWEL